MICSRRKGQYRLMLCRCFAYDAMQLFLNFAANGVNLGAKICSYIDLLVTQER